MSSTPRCATARSARASTSPSRTSWPSPGTWTTSAWASSRAAGRAPTPATPSSSPAPSRRSTSGTRSWSRSAPPAGAACKASDDPQVKALLDSGAPVVTLVAKSHDRHVELALRTTLEENLEMVRDTVSYLRAQGRRVFVDCEHFFDGYRANPAYAKAVVRTASRGRRRRGGAVRHQRRHAARPGPGRRRHRPRRHRRAARHPRPGRHRLRRRQHPRRRRRGRHPRPVHGQRLRRAGRQLQPLPRRRRPGAQVRQARSCPRARWPR